MEDKILGGLYGLLIGDACGVPYEFKDASELPPFDQIDMIPPATFDRTWPQIPPGTWSDDGSQALCMLENMLLHDGFDAASFAQTLVKWRKGYMWIDHECFDCGIQTQKAITAISHGAPLIHFSDGSCGNGSLMRTLPVALWYDKEEDIIRVAMEHSRITHGHLHCQYACAVYALMAHYLLKGENMYECVDHAFERMSPYSIQVVKDGLNKELQGSGYVIDSLWSAEAAVRTSTSFEESIRRAIAFGNDTDTTACIAGGLAGILHGYSGIPQRWKDQMRGEPFVEVLIVGLLNKRAR